MTDHLDAGLRDADGQLAPRSLVIAHDDAPWDDGDYDT
ncbi:hypothetical protein SAMN05444583_12026 [Rhodococcus maanshanensis]|uniref:Uncharacterized protein n=1 Tax=Rhodococcus maanshanensis TaxID=183556 RepID=A0A1H7V0C1_9NOCA|nr:hypothetical protein SAMN05444583_12026 [Rhodococcus maanshanensis]